MGSPRSPVYRQMKKTMIEVVQDVFKEFLGCGLTIISIYILRKVIVRLLGNELLWDYVPIRYCTDTIDFVVLVKFTVRILKSI
jgi:hypothetical protein